MRKFISIVLLFIGGVWGTVVFEEFTSEKCLMTLRGVLLYGAYSLALTENGGNDWVFDKVERPMYRTP